MPNPGYVRGTHHLTFCVGTAQEDYDFHVRLLGLKSVKKTVLFDGEIPIYHLYYGNRMGDASTILTAFPYRQAGWMGKRGTNAMRTLNLSVPADSLGFWSDRLSAAGVAVSEAELFGTQRLEFAHPCGIPYALVGVASDDREGYTGAEVPGDDRTAARRASEGANHQYEIGDDAGHGRIIELVEEPDRNQGTWQFGEG